MIIYDIEVDVSDGAAPGLQAMCDISRVGWQVDASEKE